MKFKVWDGKLGSFLSQVFYFLDNNGKLHYLHNGKISKEICSEWIIPVFCTGKKDMNNKDIYNYDILEFDKKEWGDNSNIHLVSWDAYNACWDFGGGTVSDMHFRRVIGSKLLNPELLT
ncbi:hypothetical protein KAR91_13820 [Candidatus Pacearchaeota archaeon]|nr:hypothetical protein [Candidatus Pacearchaeota archaeon]